MVSGTTIGVQYEIYFDPGSNVDFFDDILPLWSATRSRLSFESIKRLSVPVYKLVVIPVDDLDKRFRENPEASDYSKEINEYEYIIYDQPSLTWKQIEDRRLESVYYMAGVYASQVHPRLQLSIPLEEYHLKVYNHPKIDEIRRIVNTLTTINLSENEQRLIDTVVNHPAIAGKISNHSMNLVMVDW
jgi:hypothetical protein